MEKTLPVARGIMYGNVQPIFPDVELISDHLYDESYMGTWDSEASQLVLYTFCDHIFDDGADMMITPI